MSQPAVNDQVAVNAYLESKHTVYLVRCFGEVILIVGKVHERQTGKFNLETKAVMISLFDTLEKNTARHMVK